jgi:hypothetical protein
MSYHQKGPAKSLMTEKAEKAGILAIIAALLVPS